MIKIQEEATYKSQFLGVLANPKFEEAFLQKKFPKSFLLLFVNFISLVYSICNFLIYLSKYDSGKEFHPKVLFTVLVVNFIVFSLTIYLRNNFKLVIVFVYMPCILISICHLIFIDSLRIVSFVEKNDEKENYNFFLYTFTSSDVLIKLLWTNLPFNNFIYFVISNFCFFMIFFIYLITSSIDYESKVLIPIIIYFLCICFTCSVSRKMMIYEKNLFVQNINFDDYNNSKNFKINNFFNTGYMKINNFEKIYKNNFFEKENEYFEVFSKNFNENNLINQQNFIEFNNEDLREIIKNIILNINPEQKFKEFFDCYKNKLYVPSNNKQKLFFDKIDLENSSNDLVQINLEVDSKITDDIIYLRDSKLTTEKSKNDSNLTFEQVLNYFYQNHHAYTNFTSIGKFQSHLQGYKILSLEVLVRVENLQNKSDYNDHKQKYIEFIFNDETKYDLQSALINLSLKTGQFLHDFKNPLICIENEITELREENEVLISMLCKQNEKYDLCKSNY